MFEDLETNLAVDFLKAYPTPKAVSKLTSRRWNRFARREHHLSEQRCQELWHKLQQGQLVVADPVVRAKAQLLEVLLAQLQTLRAAVNNYSDRIRSFFASMPAAPLIKSLPGAKTGTIVAALWAELGDAPDRWESFRHLQAEAGAVPVTQSSGKSCVVQFRFSCNKIMRHCAYWLAFVSLTRCEWANHYYRQQRAKGHNHHRSLRALGAKWLKIIFVMWRDHKPYDENVHLANIARQQLRQAA